MNRKKSVARSAPALPGKDGSVCKDRCDRSQRVNDIVEAAAP